MYLGNGRLLTSFGILVYSAYSLDNLYILEYLIQDAAKSPNIVYKICNYPHNYLL